MIMKKILTLILTIAVVFSFTACGEPEKTEVYVFIAASLTAPMTELEAAFEEENPDVDIVLNADSSGTLMTQIEEGAEADIFFSAAQKQMNELEENGFVEEGTRQDMVNNRLCVVTLKDSETKCKGIDTLGKAKSLAIADASVPAGRYTRIALGVAEDMTTADLQDYLGTEISEQSNVSKVLAAVAEGASEVGTVYYSDTYGYEDIEILETVDSLLTGDIIYPAAQIRNERADDAQKSAAEAFLQFIKSDKAKNVYEKYYMEAI